VAKTKEEKKVVSLNDKEYVDRSSRSGSPLIKGNVETRKYANSRVNGTTLVILAALAANSTTKKDATVEDYAAGIAKLVRDNYGNPEWKNLEKNWHRGTNKSADPSKKIGPVLKGLAREIKTGALVGFSVAEIADAETRKLFGFSW
jgi:hypothetical protein